MRTFPQIHLFVVALLLLPFVTEAQVSPLRLRVEQVSKSDTTSYKSVQTRSLNVVLSNSSTTPQEVSVKYVIFGRDSKSKEVMSVGQGDLSVTIKASGTEKVSTPEAHAVAEEARIGSKGKSDDVGTKIFGYGVKVLKGEAVLAEAYDPASLKDSFGKAPEAKMPEKKKK